MTVPAKAIGHPDEAVETQPTGTGLPTALRVNPEVLREELPSAIARNNRIHSDKAHERRYLELHRKHLLAQGPKAKLVA